MSSNRRVPVHCDGKVVGFVALENGMLPRLMDHQLHAGSYLQREFGEPMFLRVAGVLVNVEEGDYAFVANEVTEEEVYGPHQESVFPMEATVNGEEALDPDIVKVFGKNLARQIQEYRAELRRCRTELGNLLGSPKEVEERSGVDWENWFVDHPAARGRGEVLLKTIEELLIEITVLMIGDLQEIISRMVEELFDSQMGVSLDFDHAKIRLEPTLLEQRILDALKAVPAH